MLVEVSLSTPPPGITSKVRHLLAATHLAFFDGVAPFFEQVSSHAKVIG